MELKTPRDIPEDVELVEKELSKNINCHEKI